MRSAVSGSEGGFVPTTAAESSAGQASAATRKSLEEIMEGKRFHREDAQRGPGLRRNPDT